MLCWQLTCGGVLPSVEFLTVQISFINSKYNFSRQLILQHIALGASVRLKCRLSALISGDLHPFWVNLVGITALLIHHSPNLGVKSNRTTVCSAVSWPAVSHCIVGQTQKKLTKGPESIVGVVLACGVRCCCLSTRGPSKCQCH